MIMRRNLEHFKKGARCQAVFYKLLELRKVPLLRLGTRKLMPNDEVVQYG